MLIHFLFIITLCLVAFLLWYILKNKIHGIILILIIIVIFFPLWVIGEIKIVPVIFNKLMAPKLEPYNQVISALESYKMSTGVYPYRLGDLVPNYIAKLPPLPEIDRISEFEYSTNIRGNWGFVGENSPPFLFGFWGSKGLGGNIILRYCAKKYDCRYSRISDKVDLLTNNNIKELREPMRISEMWVRIPE